VCSSDLLLIFGRVGRTFRKAHGRYSSQKLMPRRGTSNSSPGRSSSVRSPTVDQRKAPVGHNTLYLNSLQNGPAYYLRPPPPPPNSGGPLYTGPPQWTSLKPPLTRQTLVCHHPPSHLQTSLARSRCVRRFLTICFRLDSEWSKQAWRHFLHPFA